MEEKIIISQYFNSEKTTVNIRDLKPGVYVVRVKVQQTIMTKKLIVY